MKKLFNVFLYVFIGFVIFLISETGLFQQKVRLDKQTLYRSYKKDSCPKLAIYIYENRRKWFKFGEGGFWPKRLGGDAEKDITEAFFKFNPAEFNEYLGINYPMLQLIIVPYAVYDEIAGWDVIKICVSAIGTILGITLLIYTRNSQKLIHPKKLIVVNSITWGTLGGLVAAISSVLCLWIKVFVIKGRVLLNSEAIKMFGTSYIISTILIGIILYIPKVIRETELARREADRRRRDEDHTRFMPPGMRSQQPPERNK